MPPDLLDAYLVPRDIDKVDELMADITEQQEVAQQISDAISRPVGFGDDVDEVIGGERSGTTGKSTGPLSPERSPRGSWVSWEGTPKMACFGKWKLPFFVLNSLFHPISRMNCWKS